VTGVSDPRVLAADPHVEVDRALARVQVYAAELRRALAALGDPPIVVQDLVDRRAAGELTDIGFRRLLTKRILQQHDAPGVREARRAALEHDQVARAELDPERIREMAERLLAGELDAWAAVEVLPLSAGPAPGRPAAASGPAAAPAVSFEVDVRADGLVALWFDAGELSTVARLSTDAARRLAQEILRRTDEPGSGSWGLPASGALELTPGGPAMRVGTVDDQVELSVEAPGGSVGVTYYLSPAAADASASWCRQAAEDAREEGARMAEREQLLATRAQPEREEEAR